MADLPALRLVGGSRAGRRRFWIPGADLGPLGEAFLLYLSSRADLLSAVDCVELASVPGKSPPSPWIEVRASLTRELGRPPETVYEHLDPVPVVVEPLVQWHPARLVGGRSVVLKVVRPEVQEALPIEARALASVATALVEAGLDRAALDRALEDFPNFVEGEVDHAAELEGLGELASSVSMPGRCQVPKADPDHSGGFLLTRDPLAGGSLEDVMDIGTPGDGRDGVEAHEAIGRRRRKVRRLCRVWLGQALIDGLFPADPVGPDLRFLVDGKISFGGHLVRMPPESQAELLEYLSSVASGEMERAADALVKVLSGGAAGAEEALRHSIRHGEPFRDSGWDFQGERFVKLVLLHWREARKLGFTPRPPVGALFRGLFLLTRRIQPFEPDDQPILQGFLKVRFAMTLYEFGELADGGALAEIATRQAATLLTLPQRLDRMLSVAADRNVAASRRKPPRREAGGRRDSWAALSALLLTLVTVVVSTRHFASDGALPGWIEMVGAGLALAVGALALLATGRRL